MKVAVIGCGVVGGTLCEWFKENTDHEIYREDPGLNLDEAYSVAALLDAIFICVPVPTLKDGTQDLRILKSVLKKYQPFKKATFYIRSTVLPKTSDNLAKFFKMKIYAMPEFLTERTALKSFKKQPIICGADFGGPGVDQVNAQEEKLSALFPGKKIVLTTNREAELGKYAHNCMGAVKVNFFNLVKKYADTIGADYENVLSVVLSSGYINAEHTKVPGPDGRYGAGGKCFPKDAHAFTRELKRLGLQYGSMETLQWENWVYRANPGKIIRSPEIKYPEKFEAVVE